MRLILRDSRAQAVLADLSRNGARLVGAANLRPGQEALLRWDCHEAFGLVVWATAEHCGLRFYEPVDRAALIQTRLLDDGARRRGTKDAVREAARSFVTGQRRV